MVDYGVISEHVPYPSPSAYDNDGAHVIFIKSGQQVFIGDLLGPGYSEYLSEPYGVEGLEMSSSFFSILIYKES